MPKIDLKKIAIIILFVIIVGLLGYLLYIVFLKPAAPPTNVNIPPEVITPGLPTAPGGVPTIPGEVIPPTGLPGAPGVIGIPTTSTVPTAGPRIQTSAQGGLVLPKTIVAQNAQNPTLSANGTDLNYYDKDTGYFYRITPDGTQELLSDKAFRNVDAVTWSKNSQQAVLEYPDGSNIVYNFQTKEQTTLPAQWKDFDFSTDSSQLVFKDMKVDPENRWLAIADANGQNKQLIEQLGDKDADVYPAWSPDNKVAALYREGYDLARSKVYFVGFHGENFKSALVEGRDLRFKYSPQGAKLLYSVYTPADDYKPNLWITNAQGDLIDSARTRLELNTWADKCTFGDSITLYCAVPKEIAKYAGLNSSLNDNIADNIYKIDISTMQKTLIAEPLFGSAINELIVSADQKYLYYTDKKTGAVKKIDL